MAPLDAGLFFDGILTAAMTCLSAIPDHHLSLECACGGHHPRVPVAELPDTETTVVAVVAHACCTACGKVGTVRHARIVYALRKQ